MLTDLSERSYVETALICGCELNTVRSRLRLAKEALRESIERQPRLREYLGGGES